MLYARSRFDALTDGVFAVAMTLLVLDIRLPENASIPDESAFWLALRVLSPKALAYGLSFAVVGLAWLSRATADEVPPTMSRREALFGLLYLLCVTLVPFSTLLIGRRDALAPEVWIYCANLGLMGLLAAIMRLQIPKTHRDESFGRRIAGSLMLTIASCLAALGAGLGAHNALLAFALVALSPFLDRVVRK
ncbi:MAG: DUF1211 domain-containing protein [Hyphomicrobiales bacterium]|nr:DUF1211 domain-containing protein [Hyphomicrobiales bacterium]